LQKKKNIYIYIYIWSWLLMGPKTKNDCWQKLSENYCSVQDHLSATEHKSSTLNRHCWKPSPSNEYVKAWQTGKYSSCLYIMQNSESVVVVCSYNKLFLIDWKKKKNRDCGWAPSCCREGNGKASHFYCSTSTKFINTNGLV
jgi:hypothetical protein